MRCVALLLVALVWPVALAAQPTAGSQDTQSPGGLVEARLTDGSILIGVIQSTTPTEVVLRTIAGLVVSIDRRQLASLAAARGEVVDGEFRRRDSNATRLLFAPTGRTLAKGEAYLGVFEFVLPFVQVGVTDRFSMGAGTPLVFFGDESSRPVWLTPKYQIVNRDRLSAAVGVMHFVIFGDDTRAGLAYGVVSAGSADTGWTAGGAWAYASYRETEYRGNCFGPPSASLVPCVAESVRKTPGSPVLMIGGEHRLNSRIKVLTENYAFEAGGIVSAGVRFLGERLSADLGFFVPVARDTEFVVLPVINFVWSFGRAP